MCETTYIDCIAAAYLSTSTCVETFVACKGNTCHEKGDKWTCPVSGEQIYCEYVCDADPEEQIGIALLFAAPASTPDCSDGEDEDPSLCDTWVGITTTSTTTTVTTATTTTTTATTLTTATSTTTTITTVLTEEAVADASTDLNKTAEDDDNGMSTVDDSTAQTDLGFLVSITLASIVAAALLIYGAKHLKNRKKNKVEDERGLESNFDTGRRSDENVQLDGFDTDDNGSGLETEPAITDTIPADVILAKELKSIEIDIRSKYLEGLLVVAGQGQAEFVRYSSVFH
jgi:hypothetical protein